MEHRVEVRSTLPGVVARLPVPVGGAVSPGTVVAVVESMKMEYDIVAETAGVLVGMAVKDGDQVVTGDVLVTVAPQGGETAVSVAEPSAVAAQAGVRADLAEVRARHEAGLDAARPDAVAKRHGHGLRTARENIEDLVDPGSFVEYGPLVVAAQRARRSAEELRARTPADGLVGGVATVEGRPTAVVSYDYLVLAGTQGYRNHLKKDPRERACGVLITRMLRS